MKPSAKITVPEVIEDFWEFYAENCFNWKSMNLVLCKANYKEVQFCLDEAYKTKNIKEIILARILKKLSITQRMKISQICREREHKEKK